MKKSIVYLRFACLLLLVSAAMYTPVKADAWDCMPRPVADRLVDFLAENPYVVDYCDACANFEEGGLAGYLIRVEAARVVQCSWDPERWSVEVDFKTIAWGMVTRQGAIEELKSPQQLAVGQGPSPVYRDDTSYKLTLNYHWTISNGEPIRLGIPVRYEDEMGGENGFKAFPKWNKISNKKDRVLYMKWLRQVGG